MRYLPAVLLLWLPALAGNMYRSHLVSNSFHEMSGSFGSCTVPQDFFPVCWDLRQSYRLFREYSEHFSSDPSVEREFEALLDQAAEAGFNCFAVREELMGGDLARQDMSALDYLMEELTSRGMRLILGGLDVVPDHLDHGNGRVIHNESLLDYIGTLQDGPYGEWIIAAGASDCPDRKTQVNGWPGGFEAVAYYSERLAGLGLPFFSLMEAQGSRGNWSTGFDGFIYRFCGVISLPSYDLYPVGVHTALSRFDECLHSDFIAADIVPEEHGNYRSALTCRDELIGMDDVYGTLTATVYRIDDEPRLNRMVPRQVGSVSIAGVDPGSYRFSSSGALSSWYADPSGEPRTSGAVAFWIPGAGPEEAAILWNLNGPASSPIDPYMIPRGASVDCMVSGQDDFDPGDPASCDAILFQDEVRILCCLTSASGGGSVACVLAPEGGSFRSTGAPVPLGFRPSGGVWGYFWPWNPSGLRDHESRRSAFVVYDDTGRYAFVHRTGSSEEEWEVTAVDPEEDLLFGDIQDRGILQVSVYRSYVASSNYSLANDCLVGLIGGEQVELVVRTGRRDEFCSFQAPRPIAVEGLPGGEPEEASLAVVARGETTAEIFIHVRGDTSGVFRSLPFPERLYEAGVSDTVQVREFYGWMDGLIPGGARIRPCRKPVTSACCLLGGGDGLVHPYMFNARSVPPEPDNMLSLHESVDIELEWGVARQEGRTNCLFNTVQAWGRQTMMAWHSCPSLDSLLYLSVSPVVHGARGLFYYNLGSALECSAGGEPGRLPWVMTNWGPSPEPEGYESDMVSTVHEAVSLLTGSRDGGRDMLSPVVSPYWRVMDPDEAVQSPFDDDLNFLAFLEPRTGEVRLLAVNDSAVPRTLLVQFPDLDAVSGSLLTVHGPPGAEVLTGSSGCSLSAGVLEPFTAVLFSFETVPLRD